MKKIYKKTRNKIYRLALERYKHNMRKATYYGLCITLEESLVKYYKLKYLSNIYFDEPTYLYLYDIFPEFKQMKDKYNSNNHTYWFPINVTANRINILNEMIDLTN